MVIYIVLSVILILLVVFFASYVVAKNKLKTLVIKIDTAENSIDIL